MSTAKCRLALLAGNVLLLIRTSSHGLRARVSRQVQG
jgi:hypothetical protein